MIIWFRYLHSLISSAFFSSSSSTYSLSSDCDHSGNCLAAAIVSSRIVPELWPVDIHPHGPWLGVRQTLQVIVELEEENKKGLP